MQSNTMRLAEVAVLLDKSYGQVKRYMDKGLLHASRNGNKLIFNREEVEKFAESRGINVPKQVCSEQEEKQAEEHTIEVVIKVLKELGVIGDVKTPLPVGK